MVAGAGGSGKSRLVAELFAQVSATAPLSQVVGIRMQSVLPVLV